MAKNLNAPRKLESADTDDPLSRLLPRHADAAALSLKHASPYEDPALLSTTLHQFTRKSVNPDAPRRASDFSTLFSRAPKVEGVRVPSIPERSPSPPPDLTPIRAQRLTSDNPHVGIARTPSNTSVVFPTGPLPEIFEDRKSSGAAELTLFGGSFSESSAINGEILSSRPSFTEGTLTGHEIQRLSRSLYDMFSTTSEFRKLMKAFDDWLADQKRKANGNKSIETQEWQDDFANEVRSFLASIVEYCEGYEPYRKPSPEALEAMEAFHSAHPRTRTSSNEGTFFGGLGGANTVPSDLRRVATAHDLERDLQKWPTAPRPRRHHGPNMFHLPFSMFAERLRHLGMLAVIAASPLDRTMSPAAYTQALLNAQPLTSPDPQPITHPTVANLVECGLAVAYPSAEPVVGLRQFVKNPAESADIVATRSNAEQSQALFAAQASHIDTNAITTRGRTSSLSSRSVSALTGSGAGVLRSSSPAQEGSIRLTNTAFQSMPAALAAARRSAMPMSEDAAAAARHNRTVSSPAVSEGSRSERPTPPKDQEPHSARSSPIIKEVDTRAATRRSFTPLAIPTEAFEYLRNQMERHAMLQMYQFTYGVAKEDLQADKQVSEVLRSLCWLSPQQIRVPEGACNPLVLRTAVNELRMMNSKVSPEDKLGCVISACTVLYKALSLSAKRSGGEFAAAGADEFLPSLIYVTLQANVPKLMSNVCYIERFRDEQQMMGRAGYCFINLRSAIYYLQEFDPVPLDIPMDEYRSNVARASEGLLKPWLEQS